MGTSDMISRKMAIIQLSHNKTGDDDCDVVIQRDIETIKSLPSVQPERKLGKWISEDYELYGYCSECGFETVNYGYGVFGYDYCPNCGARLEIEEE